MNKIYPSAAKALEGVAADGQGHAAQRDGCGQQRVVEVRPGQAQVEPQPERQPPGQRDQGQIDQPALAGGVAAQGVERVHVGHDTTVLIASIG